VKILPSDETVAATKIDDEVARRLIEALASEGKLEIKPTLCKEGVRYPDAERVLKDVPPSEIENILRRLADQGVLTSKTCDRAIVCQTCLSPDIHSKYACKNCGSTEVRMIKLVEHQKCGYIAPLEDFSRNGYVSCPHCKTSSKGDEDSYRIIGTCYVCEACKQRFDVPHVIHVCQNCGKIFDHVDAWYRELKSYSIPVQVLGEAGIRARIAGKAAKLLEEHGFKTVLQASLEGASKRVHTFDLFAEKGETRLAIDVSPEGRQEAITALLAKKVDIKPTGALLLVSSNRDYLEPLGKVYGIMVIDASALEKDLLSYLKRK
jgi:hypothetical protein